MPGGRIVFQVTARPDGKWQLERQSVTSTGNVYSTKEAALADARQLAKEQTPSLIRVFGGSGTIDEEYAFPQMAEEMRPEVQPK